MHATHSLNQVAGKIDNALVGKLVGIHSLGLYARA